MTMDQKKQVMQIFNSFGFARAETAHSIAQGKVEAARLSEQRAELAYNELVMLLSSL